MQELVFPPKPWSKSKLKALRNVIVTGGEETESLSYMDLYYWYFQALSVITTTIGDIDLTGLDLSEVHLSSRVKTVTTLRDKLIRLPNMQITSIHDLMGARFAADMTLDTQDRIVERIVDHFGEDHATVSDIRRNPHSGYRAVHVILRLNGVFAEIQVRTLMQDLWANCFEELGDRVGRAIRYDGEPEADDHGLTNILLGISQGISALEETERMRLTISSASTLANARNQYVQGLKMIRESLRGAGDLGIESDVKGGHHGGSIDSL
ncbi:hypothetical protein [Bifidobacterium sp. SO1]|uniref:RelA/SpoT domain-containing protein n=1 Tax=Bifidobacterium sp. SO1 TaxID=2809029 RepID=UPI001BDC4472|nr:hypothetical protein [Bifidobacterium sp. SO1]MBT1162945.1 hypothetical protein [Bifidobacterium sp. SO1]